MNGEPDYIEINGKKIKIPDIALGKSVPDGVKRFIEERERAEKAERKANLFFWVGIAMNIVCMVGGYLLGKFL